MSKNRVKLFAVACFLGFAGLVSGSSYLFPSRAESDDVIQAIAKYKIWSKITKEPITVKIDEASLVGG